MEDAGGHGQGTQRRGQKKKDEDESRTRSSGAIAVNPNPFFPKLKQSCLTLKQIMDMYGPYPSPAYKAPANSLSHPHFCFDWAPFRNPLAHTLVYYLPPFNFDTFLSI